MVGKHVLLIYLPLTNTKTKNSASPKSVLTGVIFIAKVYWKKLKIPMLQECVCTPFHQINEFMIPWLHTPFCVYK